jgi:hypothetical protein
MRDFAVAGAFALLAGTLPAAVALAPKPGAPVAVIALPWEQDGAALRIVAAADGLLLAAAGGGGIAIATSVASDFIERLYRSGAVLVVDGATLSACLSIAREHRFSVKGTTI